MPCALCDYALGRQGGGNMLLYGQPHWGASRWTRVASAKQSHICATRTWHLLWGLNSYPWFLPWGTTMGRLNTHLLVRVINKWFDLVDWCKMHKITRKTEALLREEALDSPKALNFLTTQDLHGLGLPLGQLKLMQVALSIWQTATARTMHQVILQIINQDTEPWGMFKEQMAVRSRWSALMTCR